MFDIIIPLDTDDFELARYTVELIFLAFPQLKIELSPVPKLDFSKINYSQVEKFFRENISTSSDKSFNEYIQEHFNAEQQDKKNN